MDLSHLSFCPMPQFSATDLIFLSILFFISVMDTLLPLSKNPCYVTTVLLWTVTRGVGRRKWLFAYLICREQSPPSSRKHENMYRGDRVSHVTVEVKAVGPDLFQLKRTWQIKDRNDSG